MYRIAVVMFSLVMFAACSHGDGVGMDFNANPSISGSATMESLTVKWFGDVSAQIPDVEVKIDAARGITVAAVLSAEDGSVIDSCTGSTEIPEEEYQAVVAKVIESDLVNYAPPIEGDASCIVDETPANFGVVYEFLQAEEVLKKAFDANGCEIAPVIEELAVMVYDLAANNVTDCSAAVLGVVDEPAEAEQEQDGEDDLTDQQ